MPAEKLKVEGRLNAHRRLIVSLVALLDTVPELRGTLRRMKQEQETLVDHEEDPGVEPDETFAVQRIAAEEMSNILNAGMARSAAGARRRSSRGAAEVGGSSITTKLRR